MSKGQRGNKEAKKPKKLQAAVKPAVPVDTVPSVSNAIAVAKRKK